MTEKEIAYLALAVLAIVLLSVFVNSLLEKYSKENKYQACKLGIWAAATSKYITGGERVISIPCKREELNFDDEREKEIQKQVAESIHRCAKASGEGLNWAGAPSFQFFFGEHSPKGLCIICNVINFQGKLKEKGKPIPLVPYLRTKQIQGTGMTYAEYFEEKSQTTDFGIAFGKEILQTGMDVNKQYGIFMWDTNLLIWSRPIEWAADGMLELLGIEPIKNRGVQIREYKTLEGQCTILN